MQVAPVGTADKVCAAIADEPQQRGANTPGAVVSNPAFLKVGAAVEDFMRPDRVVVWRPTELAAVSNCGRNKPVLVRATGLGTLPLGR